MATKTTETGVRVKKMVGLQRPADSAVSRTSELTEQCDEPRCDPGDYFAFLFMIFAVLLISVMDWYSMVGAIVRAIFGRP